MLVMPAYRHAAHRIFNAAEINYAADGQCDDHHGRQSAGQLHGGREPAGLSPADGRRPRPPPTPKKWWFIGDFRKAFAYMENWPITVDAVAGRNSEAEFNQDIVVRFKASERGAAAVINPALRGEEHGPRPAAEREKSGRGSGPGV